MGYFYTQLQMSLSEVIEQHLRRFTVEELEDDEEAEYTDKEELVARIVESFKEKLYNIHLDDIVEDEISKYDFDVHRTYFTFDVRFRERFQSDELKVLDVDNEEGDWSSPLKCKSVVEQVLATIGDERLFDTPVKDMPILSVSCWKLDYTTISIYYEKHVSIHAQIEPNGDEFLLSITIKAPSCYFELCFECNTEWNEFNFKQCQKRWDKTNSKLKSIVEHILRTNKKIGDDRDINNVKVECNNDNVKIYINFTHFYTVEATIKCNKLSTNILCLNQAKLKDIRQQHV